MAQSVLEPVVYQGEFGEFTITDRDRREVIIYRSGLMVAAISFAIATALILWQGTNPTVLLAVTLLYNVFALALGVSLLVVHIYLRPLHQALQLFWIVGAIAALIFGHTNPEPFALTIYRNPLTLLGVGFTFAALTGIYFKEAFCFNRVETKLLTILVPFLLLGHLTGLLPIAAERVLLGTWAGLFLVFAIRKVIQPIPPDIGDKSVFDYLHQQRHERLKAS
jgi:uncharacterized integral membrane protein